MKDKKVLRQDNVNVFLLTKKTRCITCVSFVLILTLLLISLHLNSYDTIVHPLDKKYDNLAKFNDIHKIKFLPIVISVQNIFKMSEITMLLLSFEYIATDLISLFYISYFLAPS